MILTGLFGGRRRDVQTWAEFSRPVCLGEDLGRPETLDSAGGCERIISHESQF